MRKIITYIFIIILWSSCKKDDPKPEMYEEMTLVYRVTTPNDGSSRISYHIIEKNNYGDTVVYFAPNVWTNGKHGRTEWIYKQNAHVNAMAQVLIFSSSLSTVRTEIWLEKDGCERTVVDITETDGDIKGIGAGIYLGEELFYKCAENN